MSPKGPEGPPLTNALPPQTIISFALSTVARSRADECAAASDDHQGSLVKLGRLSSLSDVDAAIAAMPEYRTTRLTDAVLFAVGEARRFKLAGGDPQVIFFSDFLPDENNNEALRYLPRGNPAEAAGQESVPAEIDPRAYDLPLAALALLAASTVFFFLGRRIGRRRKLDVPETQVAVTDGRRTWQIPLGELEDRTLQILGRGPDAIIPASLHAVPAVSAYAKDGRLYIVVEQMMPGDPANRANAASTHYVAPPPAQNPSDSRNRMLAPGDITDASRRPTDGGRRYPRERGHR